MDYLNSGVLKFSINNINTSFWADTGNQLDGAEH